MTTMYVVEMLRYGNREAHSYVLGVFSDRVIAELRAQEHILYRSGKYTAEVRSMPTDVSMRGEVVSRFDENEDDVDLEDAIKSRQDWLNYKKEVLDPEFKRSMSETRD